MLRISRVLMVGFLAATLMIAVFRFAELLVRRTHARDWILERQRRSPLMVVGSVGVEADRMNRAVLEGTRGRFDHGWHGYHVGRLASLDHVYTLPCYP